MAAVLFHIDAAIVVNFDLKHQLLRSMHFFDHILFLPEEHSLVPKLFELGRELEAFVDEVTDKRRLEQQPHGDIALKEQQSPLYLSDGLFEITLIFDDSDALCQSHSTSICEITISVYENLIVGINCLRIFSIYDIVKLFDHG